MYGTGSRESRRTPLSPSSPANGSHEAVISPSSSSRSGGVSWTRPAACGGTSVPEVSSMRSTHRILAELDGLADFHPPACDHVRLDARAVRRGRRQAQPDAVGEPELAARPAG